MAVMRSVPVGRVFGICGRTPRCSARHCRCYRMIDFPDNDEKTGYRTRSVLCAAARDESGRLVGVVQAINKLSISDERKSVSSSDSAFTEEDSALLTAFCDQIGVAV